jgi:hypothetical protein
MQARGRLCISASSRLLSPDTSLRLFALPYPTRAPEIDKQSTTRHATKSGTLQRLESFIVF